MKSYSSIIDTSIDTSEKARIDTSEESPGRRSARLWPLLLHEIFEAQADARPENVAVVFGREETTYASLESRANRLARHLRSRGVGRGSLVAMLLRRSVDAYAAILGILKSGAAYVPIDPEYPADRVAYILEDSGAGALVTSADLARRHAAFEGAVVRVDADRDAIAAEKPLRLAREEVGANSQDLCYVIYTSGSTGRPKGVMIEHQNARRLVQAEGHIYAARSEDRVYQGASLAFDLSVEEVWLAFHAGATLVAATPEMERAGPDLSSLLTESGVTVLSSVPTLLSMLAEDVPTLRLLIFGGEPCPEWLVARWARSGRRLVNTYGPTETTVIATYAELLPGKPVTIGHAVPGYRVYLLDDDLRPAPRGEAGEICIGGAGVARGYVGLSDETRARFVADPFAPADEADARIYRSGDLGRLDANGNIEFLGRVDGQVKIRGFRVELTEIESVLLQADGLRAAACAVREDVAGIQQLVGYVVPGDSPVDEERLRSYLRSHLPAYMVPALIETVTDLPLLPSGKLDRASLPAPRARRAAKAAAGRPLTITERRIAKVWKDLFSPLPVSLDDHFFHDLGGHSLLAARMVSMLRKNPSFARLSVTDVYERPTIASLASALEAAAPRSQQPGAEGSTEAGNVVPTSGRQHFLVGVIQSVGLYFVFGLRGLQWITPYLVFFLLIEHELPVYESAAWAAVSEMAVFPLLVLVAVMTKWLVLGRVRPGRYPLWGRYYLRWWFAQAIVASVPANYLLGTPLLPLFYRLLGARIGRNVYIATDRFAAFDLISIGDGASVDDDASLFGQTVENGELVIGPVTVGRRCFVGTRAVLREGAVMEDGARLEDLSLLPSGARIPAGETWAGSPARRVSVLNPAPLPPLARGPLRRAAIAALYAALVLAMPILLLGAFAPGMALLMHLDLVEHTLVYLAAAPLVGASFVLLITTELVILKWLLVGRVRAGTYPLHGGFYVRNWIADQLRALSHNTLGPLHATLYMTPWYRLFGAKLGRFVELSTATAMMPDLLEIGDGGTVADEASLGAGRVEGGWMTLARTRVGRRAFIGNSAVVPAGAELGEGSLVGVLSLAPPTGEGARPCAAWLGSPPRLLPRREASAGFTEERTYCPPRRLVLTRAAVEVLRITLAPAGFILVTAAVITAALSLWHSIGAGATLGLLPLIYGACCAIAIVAVALIKWIVVGRYRPFVRPLWSAFVWRLEFVNALYEFFATPLALLALQGTPLLPWYFRLLGARIGRRVYMHTTGLLEWDLVEVGHRVALNDDCVLQTHLFEDRVLKGSRLYIGADCAVGAGSVLLYDSKMEDGARLNALSLLMKGETLPACTAWAGLPAVWQGGAKHSDADQLDLVRAA
ncbi:MAG TPA: Pls/PosA family non-ribosomal peptide synthetase [Blastocatellia bacterium]|jgi:non-ribosomal peptide synthetase-like protein